MKENIEYYRHFSGADQHPKFEMLRAKYGWSGDGKFWALNNRIALASNCVLDLSKKYVKASIANALDFTLSEFDEFVIYLLEECDLIIETDSGITTEEVQENYIKVAEKRMRNKAGYVKKPILKTAESSTKLAGIENQPTGMQIQLSENIQTKVKETKVNETKVNESKVNKSKDVVIIINDLNERLGYKKGYSAKSEKTQSLILARLKEGYSLEDFITVNEKKVNSWQRDPNMCKYLRPETLYGNKFEGYLNEIIVSDNDALRFNQGKQGKKPSTKERLANAWAEMGVDPENNSLVKPETGKSNVDSTGVKQGVNVIEFGIPERGNIKRLN
jgi:uncharacterized phage protein (TIGR02220 family)